MSKYFNKALFFTERKTILYSMISYSVLYLLCIFQAIVNIHTPAKYMNQILPEAPYYLVNVLYFWFIVIAYAAVIDSFAEKNKKYNFMLTQPFSRDSIIITKTFSFLMSFLIPTIVYGLTAYMLLILNPSYYGSYYAAFSRHLFLTLLGLISVIAFVTMFAQLMQMMFGKAIGGLIFPIVLYFMLFFSFNVGGSFISKRLDLLRTTISYINRLIFNGGISFASSNNFTSASIYVSLFIEDPKIYVSLILIVLATVIFYVSLLLNRKIKTENTSAIFLFKFSETIFKVIFSLAITIIGSLVLSGALYYLYSSIKGVNFSTYLIRTYGLSGKETIEHNLYLALNLAWIPLFAIVYRVFTKLMNARRAA